MRSLTRSPPATTFNPRACGECYCERINCFKMRKIDLDFREAEEVASNRDDVFKEAVDACLRFAGSWWQVSKDV